MLLLTQELHGGVQKLYKFENGFGASVVSHAHSYGGDSGLWELAVIKFEDDDSWDLTYDTDITDDVFGYLEWQEVYDLLDDIAQLDENGVRV